MNPQSFYCMKLLCFFSLKDVVSLILHHNDWLIPLIHQQTLAAEHNPSSSILLPSYAQQTPWMCKQEAVPLSAVQSDLLP